MLRSLRKIIWYLSGFLKKQKTIILTSFMLGIFVTFVTTLFFKMPSFIAHREKFGLVGSFSFENLPREIQEKLSFGLTGVKENGDVYPHHS